MKVQLLLWVKWRVTHYISPILLLLIVVGERRGADLLKIRIAALGFAGQISQKARADGVYKIKHVATAQGVELWQEFD